MDQRKWTLRGPVLDEEHQAGQEGSVSTQLHFHAGVYATGYPQHPLQVHRGECSELLDHLKHSEQP